MAFADLVARVDRTAITLLGEREPVLYRVGGGSGGFSPAFSGAFAGAPTAPEALVFGIFDDSFVLAQGNAESGVEARLPTVFLELADLPSDPMIDDPILTIRAVDYRVVERRPADFGSIALGLRKVA